MTTIAWDGEILAADRQVSANQVNTGTITKIVKRKKDGALCAAAGTASEAAAFLRWFLAGEKGPSPLIKSDTNSQGFIVRPDRKIHVFDDKGWFEIDSKYKTLGSGWEIALGAIGMGAFADKAVQVAAMYDQNTGTDIDILYLGREKGKRNG